MPEVAIRTTLVVGFPGETDEHVEELAEFLQAAQLDWAGFFPFSAEEGTPAVDFDDQLDEDVIAERLRYVQATQDDITTSRNLAQVGREFELLIDQVEDDQPVGRSYRQAPEIDGVVLLDRGEPGEWVTGKITGGYGTDLIAEVIG